MTTFTTEDKEYFLANPWGNPWASPKDFRQTEMVFFWPLTEQIPLSLDYSDCVPPKLYTVSNTTPTGYLFGTIMSTTVSNVPAQLTITPNNPMGQLTIGPMSIGLESEPKWYQKVLYKLLGFDWNDSKKK